MKLAAAKKEEYKTLLKRTRVPHTSYEEARKELDRAFDALGTTSFPQCRHLSAVSRTGKSMLVTDFQERSPTIRTDEGSVSKIVYACIPPKGTTMGLLENLLFALGDPYWERGSESRKLARLINLLEKCKCRAMILDEFQHLADKGQKNAALQFTIDFIKSLLDPNKWLLIASGLPSADSVIRKDPQLRNRFPPALKLPRFDWFDYRLRGEFMGVLTAFEEALHPFDLPRLGCEEMAMRFYLATGGLIGLVTRILQRAVEIGLEENRLTITNGHLTEAFEREVWFAEEYHGIGPFKMKINKISIDNKLKVAGGLVEAEKSEVYQSQTEVIIKSSEAGKVVTKATHNKEMAMAL